jgi:DNA-binding beta-propeller fold protein YncE
MKRLRLLNNGWILPITYFLLLCMLITGKAVHAASPPIVSTLTPITEGISTPHSLVADASGTLFLTDPRAGGVLRINSSGVVQQVIRTGKVASGIGLNKDGNLLVSQGNSVVVLDRVTGNEIGKLGIGAGQFKHASGIAVDATGLIYVVDSLDNCIQVFAADTAYLTRFGGYGSLNGQFSMPTGIAYDKVNNQLAVADTFNGRIQIFSTQGAYLKSYGNYGSGPMQFTAPEGIAFEYTVDAVPAVSRIYVVDSFQSNVQSIDPTGAGDFLAFIGSYGNGAGQLVAPSGVAYDQSNNRLIVANGFGNLTVYGIDGGTTPGGQNQQTNALTVGVGGYGGGTVTSNPVGISTTSGSQTAVFNSGMSVTLYATPDANSIFAGWGGACSGTGACTVNLSSPRLITANFDQVPMVKVDGPTPAYYPSIQAAYNATEDGSTVRILTRSGEYYETLSLDRNINLRIEGGYDINFTNTIGYSYLRGVVTLQQGTVILSNYIQ